MPLWVSPGHFAAQPPRLAGRPGVRCRFWSTRRWC